MGKINVLKFRYMNIFLFGFQFAGCFYNFFYTFLGGRVILFINVLFLSLSFYFHLLVVP